MVRRRKKKLDGAYNSAVFANPNYSADQTGKLAEFPWGFPRV